VLCASWIHRVSRTPEKTVALDRFQFLLAQRWLAAAGSNAWPPALRNATAQVIFRGNCFVCCEQAPRHFGLFNTSNDSLDPSQLAIELALVTTKSAHSSGTTIGSGTAGDQVSLFVRLDNACFMLHHTRITKIRLGTAKPADTQGVPKFPPFAQLVLGSVTVQIYPEEAMVAASWQEAAASVEQAIECMTSKLPTERPGVQQHWEEASEPLETKPTWSIHIRTLVNTGLLSPNPEEHRPAIRVNQVLAKTLQSHHAAVATATQQEQCISAPAQKRRRLETQLETAAEALCSGQTDHLQQLRDDWQKVYKECVGSHLDSAGDHL